VPSIQTTSRSRGASPTPESDPVGSHEPSVPPLHVKCPGLDISAPANLLGAIVVLSIFVILLLFSVYVGHPITAILSQL
jgi:hypothetical protein